MLFFLCRLAVPVLLCQSFNSFASSGSGYGDVLTSLSQFRVLGIDKRRYRELFVDRCWQWWHGRIPSIQSGRLGRVLGRAINCVGRFLA
jgi:hypothetical protein